VSSSCLAPKREVGTPMTHEPLRTPTKLSPRLHVPWADGLGVKDSPVASAPPLSSPIEHPGRRVVAPRGLEAPLGCRPTRP